MSSDLVLRKLRDVTYIQGVSTGMWRDSRKRSRLTDFVPLRTRSEAGPC